MAFRGNSYKPKAKKKGTSLYYPYTKEDMKRVGWCMNKGIFVAVFPSSGTKWKVEITINKKRHLDPGEYEHDEAMEKLYKYYKYYYDKNKE